MPLRKTLAACISVNLLFTQVLFATAPEQNLWEQRRQSLQHRQVAQLTVPSPVRTSIQSQLPPTSALLKKSKGRDEVSKIVSLLSKDGVVRDISLSRNNASSPVVVYIQDVHGKLEAQKNIGSMISKLVEANNKTVIGLEGTAGAISIHSFRHQERELNQKNANFLLTEGIITGGEFAGFIAAQSPSMIGVENKELYLNNVAAVRQSLSLQKKQLAQIEKQKRSLNQRKSVTYSAALTTFDQKWNDHTEGKLNLSDYIDYLRSQSKEILVPANIALFLKIISLEKSLDFEKAERQRNNFLTRLVQKLNQSDLNQLMEQSVALRSGELPYPDYYRLLKHSSEKAGLSLATVPEFDRYIGYILQADAIRAEELLTEVAAFEKTISTSLCATAEQRLLLEESHRLRLTEKLCRLTLTPAEWKEYKSELKTNSDLRSFESFYEIAESRNDAMIGNLLAATRQNKNNPAVLVAGGFHSDGLTKALTKENITLITVTPKLTEVGSTTENDYLNVFTREKTPLELLFESPKISLTATLWTKPLYGSMAGKEGQRAADFISKGDIEAHYRIVEQLAKPTTKPKFPWKEFWITVGGAMLLALALKWIKLYLEKNVANMGVKSAALGLDPLSIGLLIVVAAAFHLFRIAAGGTDNWEDLTLKSTINLSNRQNDLMGINNFGMRFLYRIKNDLLDHRETPAKAIIEYMFLLEDTLNEQPIIGLNTIDFDGLQDHTKRLEAMSFYLYGEILPREELFARLDRRDAKDLYLLDHAMEAFTLIAEFGFREKKFDFKQLLTSFQHRIKGMRLALGQVYELEDDTLGAAHDFSRRIQASPEIDFDLLRRAIIIAQGNTPKATPPTTGPSAGQIIGLFLLGAIGYAWPYMPWVIAQSSVHTAGLEHIGTILFVGYLVTLIIQALPMANTSDTFQKRLIEDLHLQANAVRRHGKLSDKEIAELVDPAKAKKLIDKINRMATSPENIEKLTVLAAELSGQRSPSSPETQKQNLALEQHIVSAVADYMKSGLKEPQKLTIGALADVNQSDVDQWNKIADEWRAQFDASKSIRDFMSFIDQKWALPQGKKFTASNHGLFEGDLLTSLASALKLVRLVEVREYEYAGNKVPVYIVEETTPGRSRIPNSYNPHLDEIIINYEGVLSKAQRFKDLRDIAIKESKGKVKMEGLINPIAYKFLQRVNDIIFRQHKSNLEQHAMEFTIAEEVQHWKDLREAGKDVRQLYEGNLKTIAAGMLSDNSLKSFLLNQDEKNAPHAARAVFELKAKIVSALAVDDPYVVLEDWLDRLYDINRLKNPNNFPYAIQAIVGIILLAEHFNLPTKTPFSTVSQYPIDEAMNIIGLDEFMEVWLDGILNQDKNSLSQALRSGILEKQFKNPDTTIQLVRQQTIAKPTSVARSAVTQIAGLFLLGALGYSWKYLPWVANSASVPYLTAGMNPTVLFVLIVVGAVISMGLRVAPQGGKPGRKKKESVEEKPASKKPGRKKKVETSAETPAPKKPGRKKAEPSAKAKKEPAKPKKRAAAKPEQKPAIVLPSTPAPQKREKIGLIPSLVRKAVYNYRRLKMPVYEVAIFESVAYNLAHAKRTLILENLDHPTYREAVQIARDYFDSRPYPFRKPLVFAPKPSDPDVQEFFQLVIRYLEWISKNPTPSSGLQPTEIPGLMEDPNLIRLWSGEISWDLSSGDRKLKSEETGELLEPAPSQLSLTLMQGKKTPYLNEWLDALFDVMSEKNEALLKLGRQIPAFGLALSNIKADLEKVKRDLKKFQVDTTRQRAELLLGVEQSQRKEEAETPRQRAARVLGMETTTTTPPPAVPPVIEQAQVPPVKRPKKLQRILPIPQPKPFSFTIVDDAQHPPVVTPAAAVVAPPKLPKPAQPEKNEISIKRVEEFLKVESEQRPMNSEIIELARKFLFVFLKEEKGKIRSLSDLIGRVSTDQEQTDARAALRYLFLSLVKIESYEVPFNKDVQKVYESLDQFFVSDFRSQLDRLDDKILVFLFDTWNTEAAVEISTLKKLQYTFGDNPIHPDRLTNNLLLFTDYFDRLRFSEIYGYPPQLRAIYNRFDRFLVQNFRPQLTDSLQLSIYNHLVKTPEGKVEAVLPADIPTDRQHYKNQLEELLKAAEDLEKKIDIYAKKFGLTQSNQQVVESIGSFYSLYLSNAEKQTADYPEAEQFGAVLPWNWYLPFAAWAESFFIRIVLPSLFLYYRGIDLTSLSLVILICLVFKLAHLPLRGWVHTFNSGDVRVLTRATFVASLPLLMLPWYPAVALSLYVFALVPLTIYHHNIDNPANQILFNIGGLQRNVSSGFDPVRWSSNQLDQWGNHVTLKSLKVIPSLRDVLFFRSKRVVVVHVDDIIYTDNGDNPTLVLQTLIYLAERIKSKSQRKDVLVLRFIGNEDQAALGASLKSQLIKLADSHGISGMKDYLDNRAEIVMVPMATIKPSAVWEKVKHLYGTNIWFDIMTVRPHQFDEKDSLIPFILNLVSDKRPLPIAIQLQNNLASKSHA